MDTKDILIEGDFFFGFCAGSITTAKAQKKTPSIKKSLMETIYDQHCFQKVCVFFR